MPSHNDLKEFVEGRRAERSADRVRQASTIIADGVRAKAAIDHPVWGVFADKVEELRKAATAGVASQRQAYLHAATAKSARLAKRAAFLSEGAEAAFTQVLAILPGMIQDAEKARETLG